MNKLEELGLKEALYHIYEAKKKCHKDNEKYMESSRIHIEGDLKRAIEVIQSIFENNQKPNT